VGTGLHDRVILDEIELLSDLVIAATASPRHMGNAEIDRVLGIEPREQRPSAPEPDRTPPTIVLP